MTLLRSRKEKRRRSNRTTKNETSSKFRRLSSRLHVEPLENRWLPSFTIVPLGTLGGPTSQAYSINNAGQIVGKSDINASGTFHAFLWDDGVMTDLGTLGGSQSIAYDINNLGQIAGESRTSGGVDEATFWNTNLSISSMGVLPGSVGSNAYAINDSGTAVGYSKLNLTTINHGFKWDAVNGMKDLGVLPGGISSTAFDINNAGYIVGVSSTGQTLYLSAYVPVGGTSFIELPNAKYPGAVGSTAVSVNDSEVITGKAKIHSAQGPHHVYHYENGTIVDLGAIPGANRSSTPYKINNDGIIVGESDIGVGTRHGIVYFNGTMYDLNDLVSAETGIIVRNALSINDHGQIASVCSYSDLVDFACLLQPDAVRLEVSAVANTAAGAPFDLTITAYDMFGYTVPGYTGTVHFSSTDYGASIPSSYTFTTNDEGVHTFTGLRLYSAGNQAIRVVDSANAALADSVQIGVIGTAAHNLFVAIPTNATAGVPTKITVMARDEFGNLNANYNGTIHFYASDPLADVPNDTPLVNGVRTFTVTLKTAGLQNFIVNDTLAPEVFGISAVVDVTPAAATGFVVTGPPVARAGKTSSFIVQAVDAYGNTATGYTGTAVITSSDGNALIGKPATLVNGVGTFNVTLRTAGTRTVAATDSINPGITGTSDGINVVASYLTTFTISAPASSTAGVPFNITVTARDTYGNVVNSYSGPIVFSSTDVQAVLPPESSMTNGVGTFEITLKTSGNHALTVAHNTSAVIAANATVAVNPAAAADFKVTLPTIAKSHVAYSLTVTAVDLFGNHVPTYAGTIKFDSTDRRSALPPNSTLTGGIGTFSITMNTAGSQLVIVTDTVDPSVSGNASTTVGTTAPTPAASFSVSAPANATAGVPVTVTVTALDASSSTATGYTGTVALTSSDGQALLPANATLTNGVGTFTVVFRTAGSRAVTATDTVNAGITGSSTATTVAAGAMTQMSISAPPTAVAGVSFPATLTALDAFNNIVPTTMVARLTSTDLQAVLPPSVVFTNGVANIQITFKTAGVQSFVPKAGGSSLTGVGTVTVAPAAVSKFGVTLPAEVVAGSPFSMTVTALDAFNNSVPTYSGTVHFTSSDGQAVLPADATLVNGTKVFTVTLKTGFDQTITATDVGNGSITGGSNAFVDPGAAVTFNISGGVATAGGAFSFVVEAVDAYGNLATDYTGVMTFTSSDGQAELTANSTLAYGAGIFSMVLKTAGPQTITVTDTVNASITGDGNVTVNPGDAVEFSVSAPTATDAGDVFSITVTALDEFGNVATGYSGTVFFAGNDYQAVSPADSTLTNGVGTFEISLATAGVRNITVTDRTDDGIWGQASVTVIRGPVSTFILVPPPLAPFVGQQFTMTVTARDGYENLVDTYNGTVAFSSSDPNAVLPPAGSVVNNGIATFNFTLYKAQQQTVTVTDTNNASITDTAQFPIKPGAAVSYLITGPSTIVAGTPFSITVEAKDQYGNKSGNYAGTVCFTSTDTSAVLPPCSTLINGNRTFDGLVLNTVGLQTITAKDSANSSIDGDITIDVTGRSSPPSPILSGVRRRTAPAGRVVQAQPPQATDEVWSEHWLKYSETPTTKITPATSLAEPLVTGSKAKKASPSQSRAVVSPQVRPVHFLSDELSAE